VAFDAAILPLDDDAAPVHAPTVLPATGAATEQIAKGADENAATLDANAQQDVEAEVVVAVDVDVGVGAGDVTALTAEDDDGDGDRPIAVDDGGAQGDGDEEGDGENDDDDNDGYGDTYNSDFESVSTKHSGKRTPRGATTARAAVTAAATEETAPGPAPSSGSEVASSLQLGDKVEANYGGRGEYYPGKIVKVRANGTFDVQYDDGDREDRVRGDLIRRPGAAPANSVIVSAPTPSKYKIKLYL
jgi:hypothetical protein